MAEDATICAKAPAKYFDFLNDFGEELGEAIGFPKLVKKVSVWRRIGAEDPDSVLVGCRNVIEHAVCKLNDVKDTRGTNLESLIFDAEEAVSIDHPTALKLQEIRKKGNKAAHEGGMSQYDASAVLELLEGVLRSFCWTFGVGEVPVDVEINDDYLFRPLDEGEVRTLLRNGRTATLVSGDARAETEMANAVKLARESRAVMDQAINAIGALGMMKQKMEDHGQRFGLDDANAPSHGEGASNDALAADEDQALQSQLFDTGDMEAIDSKIEELKAQVKKCNQDSIAEIEMAQAHVREVLNEHDFIRKLLGQDKHATMKQMEVMAFPRQEKTRTRILQIAGGAGTGKSLCLLAKLIAEVDGSQGRLALTDAASHDDPRAEGPRALFICYNLGLRVYMEGLLESFPEAKARIDVVSFDGFFNQMVKHKSNFNYAWLNGYAKDVRYPEGWRITYGNEAKVFGVEKNVVKKAMRAVAERHPELDKPYYLDVDDKNSVSWVNDELLWLEARYDDEAQAAKHYPQARRVGRGTKRLPNADVRSVILEIFHAYHELLKEEHKYTIYQAVKKLLKSEQLPRYDAIAVDEVQDLALLQVRLVMKLRRNDGSRVYISGDEDQKIYQRDFTWKQLDSGVKGHTITLDENKRNGPGISEFANRLTSNAGLAFAATASQVPAAAQSKAKLTRFEGVELGSWDDEKLIRLLANLQNLGETTAVIGKTNVLVAESKKLPTGELSFAAVDEKPVTEPGLYECRAKKGKGLEFDNVVVDYSYVAGDDYDEEKRLRYVHFTRPRKRLYVRYPVDDVPQLLLDYYADCLPGLGND